MKTGIIRRLDDLGRIVIPKEIRRSLHLSENDPLEISIEDKKLVFEPYTQLSEAEQVLIPCLAVFRKYQKTPIVITSKHEIIFSSLVSITPSIELSHEICDMMKNWKESIFSDKPVYLTDSDKYQVGALFPITDGDEIIGSVMLLYDNGIMPTEEQIICGRFFSQILSEKAGEQ